MKLSYFSFLHDYPVGLNELTTPWDNPWSLRHKFKVIRPWNSQKSLSLPSSVLEMDIDGQKDGMKS